MTVNFEYLCSIRGIYFPDYKAIIIHLGNNVSLAASLSGGFLLITERAKS